MISDVAFDLAGSSAIAALSPNGWHLAVVRHGVSIDFFDARDLCSSTPSNPTAVGGGGGGGGASFSAHHNGTAGEATNLRSRQRKLGSLQGSFATVDDVSSLVWSPDSTMVAACMETRAALTVVSAFPPFHSIATVEGALNGTRAHVVWHPSSRAVYWAGLAQTHVLNLSDGATMVLDYHAKVMEDPRAAADGSAGGSSPSINGQHRAAPLPLWAMGEPCPSPTAAAASSPCSSKVLMCFSNGDGAAAKEYRQAMAAAISGGDQQQSKSAAAAGKSGAAAAAAGSQRAKGNHSTTATEDAAACPALFLCMVSPCSVAAVPGSAGGNVAGIRAGMMAVLDPNTTNNNNSMPQVLVNASSAQSVASTTAVLEEAAGVRGAAYNSRITITTEFFHVFSSVTHELVFSFPIRLADASSPSNNASTASMNRSKNNNNNVTIETGGEFYASSFCVAPCFIALHDSFSSVVAVFSHRGENIGPNVRNATAYAITPGESVDCGSTLAVVHGMCTLSIFCAVSARSTSPLVRLFTVDLARPQTYMGFSCSAAASAAASASLVVLAERIAPDDLLERARNEAMTEKARQAHRADPAHTMPAAPTNRSMYEVLMPRDDATAAAENDELGNDEASGGGFVPFDISSSGTTLSSSSSGGSTLSLIPGLRSKSLLGLCHDAQSRQIVEEFLRHTMRKTEVRNMMDDVMNGQVSSSAAAAKQRRNSSSSAVTFSTTSAKTSFANLSQVSADVLSEIAPLTFCDFGFCAITSFHSPADHSDQLFVACTVPMFPTCVWVVDAAAGKVVSLLQQKHVVTTLSWKPPRDVLLAQQPASIHRHSNSNMRPLNHLDDPILAFTTDSHVGCLYIWTPESALCVAMPEIAKVASHIQHTQRSAALSDRNANHHNSASVGTSEKFECRMHIGCENPNCKRNWLHRQKEIDRRRAFERGELGGFRCTTAAWTDAGNTLMLVDTVRGSHVVASLVPSRE